jgi:hypothetical protein
MRLFIPVVEDERAGIMKIGVTLEIILEVVESGVGGIVVQ